MKLVVNRKLVAPCVVIGVGWGLVLSSLLVLLGMSIIIQINIDNQLGESVAIAFVLLVRLLLGLFIVGWAMVLVGWYNSIDKKEMVANEG